MNLIDHLIKCGFDCKTLPSYEVFRDNIDSVMVKSYSLCGLNDVLFYVPINEYGIVIPPLFNPDGKRFDIVNIIDIEGTEPFLAHGGKRELYDDEKESLLKLLEVFAL